MFELLVWNCIGVFPTGQLYWRYFLYMLRQFEFRNPKDSRWMIKCLCILSAMCSIVQSEWVTSKAKSLVSSKWHCNKCEHVRRQQQWKMFLPRLDRAFKKKTTDPSADSIINSNEDQGQTTDAKLYMAGTDKVFLCNGLYKQINQLPFWSPRKLELDGNFVLNGLTYICTFSFLFFNEHNYMKIN